jgi:hypothetical protein
MSRPAALEMVRSRKKPASSWAPIPVSSQPDIDSSGRRRRSRHCGPKSATTTAVTVPTAAATAAIAVIQSVVADAISKTKEVTFHSGGPRTRERGKTMSFAGPDKERHPAGVASARSLSGGRLPGERRPRQPGTSSKGGRSAWSRNGLNTAVDAAREASGGSAARLGLVQRPEFALHPPLEVVERPQRNLGGADLAVLVVLEGVVQVPDQKDHVCD